MSGITGRKTIDQAIRLQTGCAPHAEFVQAVADLGVRFFRPHGDDGTAVFSQEPGIGTVIGQVHILELGGDADLERARSLMDDEPLREVPIRVQMSPSVPKLTEEDVESAGRHRTRALCGNLRQGVEETRPGTGALPARGIDVQAALPQSPNQLLVLPQPVSQLEGPLP